MKPFLDNVARDLVKEHPENLDKLCIVLPNRRSGIFLKRAFANLLNKPVFAPMIFSVEDFIFSLCGYTKADPIELLVMLYKVHERLDPGSSFADFLRWGQVMLDDFNELDLQMADPHSLFTFLSETKAINLWNPGSGSLTDFQKSYLDFFMGMEEHYQVFNAKLIEKKLLYQGLAYRYTAENLEDISIDYEKVCFVGLNALSVAEDKIVQYLLKNRNAVSYWDADDYYIDDSKQEAGKFIREYKDRRGDATFKWSGKNLETGSKSIHIIGLPGTVVQAKHCGNLLAHMGDKAASYETAVVMANEKLLQPVLNSIPAHINEFNITMGFPLVHLPVYNLFEYCLDLYENSQILSQSKPGAVTKNYYLRDLIKITEHPYIISYLVNNGSVLAKETEKWIAANRVYLPGKEIQGSVDHDDPGSKLLHYLLESHEDARDFIISMQGIIEILKDSIEINSPGDENRTAGTLETEYLYRFAKLLHTLSLSIKELDAPIDLSSLRRLFETVARSTSIPFTGEPLKGLQIMGMLETRALDFKRVILLSVNEGHLPSAARRNSFIPFDIQKHYGLHTHHEKNAIFAYHFYRLLQRAEDIYLLYNTESDNLGGGEPSRFIMQIESELSARNPDIKVYHETISAEVKIDDVNRKIRIPKTGNVMDRVHKSIIKGLSPSALNLFRNCSLRYYFSKIAGMKDTEELEESLGARDIGNAIHYALLLLYKEYIGKTVQKNDIEGMKKIAGAVIEEAFLEETKFREFDRGRNLLFIKASLNTVLNFLSHEIKMISGDKGREGLLEIIELEKVFNISIKLDIPGTTDHQEINLTGKIDRIDKINGDIRIIDYKSGSVQAADLKLKDIEDLRSGRKTDKAFQLLFYAWLYCKETKITTEIESGIIALRKISLGFQHLVVAGSGINSDVLAAFEDVLKDIAGALLDPSIDFSQTDDKEYCKYCSFRDVCNR